MWHWRGRHSTLTAQDGRSLRPYCPSGSRMTMKYFHDRPGRDFRGQHDLDRLALLVGRLEVVVELPSSELPPDRPGGGVGGAEVEPQPHPGIDDILEQRP